MRRGMDEERLTLDEHRFRASEFAHRFSELCLCRPFQIQSEHWCVVAAENTLEYLMVLLALGSDKTHQCLTWAPFGIDELQGLKRAVYLRSRGPRKFGIEHGTVDSVRHAQSERFQKSSECPVCDVRWDGIWFKSHDFKLGTGLELFVSVSIRQIVPNATRSSESGIWLLDMARTVSCQRVMWIAEYGLITNMEATLSPIRQAIPDANRD